MPASPLKKWMIKNNGFILGPFTEEEVFAEWKKGYLSPFATASLPGQACWLFITNYKEFSHLKYHIMEDTREGDSFPTVTHTQDLSKKDPGLSVKTPPPTVFQEEEITKKIKSPLGRTSPFKNKHWHLLFFTLFVVLGIWLVF